MLTPRPNQNSALKGGVLTGIQFYQNSCFSWISRGAINLPCFLKAIQFSGDHVPTLEQLNQMHHEAHEECFIANSVKTQIRCEPVYVAL